MVAIYYKKGGGSGTPVLTDQYLLLRQNGWNFSFGEGMGKGRKEIPR
jgi:hypothetical protein